MPATGKPRRAMMGFRRFVGVIDDARKADADFASTKTQPCRAIAGRRGDLLMIIELPGTPKVIARFTRHCR